MPVLLSYVIIWGFVTSCTSQIFSSFSEKKNIYLHLKLRILIHWLQCKQNGEQIIRSITTIHFEKSKKWPILENYLRPLGKFTKEVEVSDGNKKKKKRNGGFPVIWIIFKVVHSLFLLARLLKRSLIFFLLEIIARLELPCERLNFSEGGDPGLEPSLAPRWMNWKGWK